MASYQPTTPLVAQGDWTKNLVHLAKTAELKYVVLVIDLFSNILANNILNLSTEKKCSLIRIYYFRVYRKHALTLQLHTAHILTSHGTLESKNKALQDIKEQKDRLESERMRLLNCLRQVNEDRDKVGS